MRAAFLPLSRTEQAFHKVILRRRLAVFRAAVFFHDLEYLIPEPNRMVHVVDADVDKRGRNRLPRGGVLGEETNAVGHFLALHPTSGTHSVSETGSRNPHKTHETPPPNCSAAGFTYVLKKPESLISSGFRA